MDTKVDGVEGEAAGPKEKPSGIETLKTEEGD